MVKRMTQKLPAMVVAFLLLTGVILYTAQTGNRATPASQETVSREKILKFIREKFGVLDSVKLSADAFRASDLPGFYESKVTAEDGKQTHSQEVYVSTDSRYLILGQIFPVGSDPNGEIIRHVREAYKLPITSAVTLGAYRDSSFPNFLEASVSVSDATRNQTQVFYATKDRRFFVLGSVYTVQANLRREFLRLISTKDQPSQGPATAPVTIVEYSDLQCPLCARFHEFLERDVVPKYGSKVKIVFKEFPLVAAHDWTLTAATAAQCVYQINPPAFVPYRSLVFERQNSVNAANARELLLAQGEQVGVDRVALGACIDSKASLPRVEANLREGQTLGITRTPTSFVNGRIVVGMPAPEGFFSVVDEALRAAK